MYTVEVANAADAGTGAYDLTDTPAFSPGITIDELTVENTAPGTIATNAGFGTGDSSIVTGETIAQGVTHTYEVTAEISVAFDTDVTYVECGPGQSGPGGGLLNSATITVDGEEVDGETCTDLPGDLKLEKDDGGITVIADGAPFTYTLTITNVVGISTGSPVTVTDRLPAKFEWDSYPDVDGSLPFCEPNAINPEFLDCEIDPALVDVGGKSTTIELTARAKADITPATYENLAYVDSPLDPTPTDPLPECPPTTGGSNGGVTEPLDDLIAAVVPLTGDPSNNVASTRRR